jgi:DNA-binding protein
MLPYYGSASVLYQGWQNCIQVTRVNMIPLNIFLTYIESGDAKMPEDNVIYVGNKSVMSYVLAVVTQFNNGFDEVVIKARGRAISRAVDTAEVVKNKFMPGVEVKDIKIGTEVIVGEGGDKANVSSVEITMKTKA